MEFDIEQKKIFVTKLSETPKIATFLIKGSGGIIKTEKQAEHAILAICTVLLCILAYWWMNIFNLRGESVSPLIYQEDITPEFKKTLSDEELLSIPYKYEK